MIPITSIPKGNPLTKILSLTNFYVYYVFFLNFLLLLHSHSTGMNKDSFQKGYERTFRNSIVSIPFFFFIFIFQFIPRTQVIFDLNSWCDLFLWFREIYWNSYNPIRKSGDLSKGILPLQHRPSTYLIQHNTTLHYTWDDRQSILEYFNDSEKYAPVRRKDNFYYWIKCDRVVELAFVGGIRVSCCLCVFWWWVLWSLRVNEVDLFSIGGKGGLWEWFLCYWKGVLRYLLQLHDLLTYHGNYFHYIKLTR